MGYSSSAGSKHRDVIVIGSGFGGSLAAWPLVHAGLDVLMLERGPWVDRDPKTSVAEETLIRTPYFNEGTGFRAVTDRGRFQSRSGSCVGGNSVFYAAVSLRFREEDFSPGPEIVTDSGSQWPIGYDDLEPYYERVENILAVAGRPGVDPTEPRRRNGYGGTPPTLSDVSRRIGAGAESLGLHPFPLPLAINFPNGQSSEASGTCTACPTCDTFACPVGAKGDLATRVIPRLLEEGMEISPQTAVTRLHLEGDRIAAVDCVARDTGERYTLTADLFILGAGALGSAQLALSSGLAERNPAGDVVGRYLTRHCTAIVYGAYSWGRKLPGDFQKQLGIHDYYFGDPEAPEPTGKLGSIQQVQTPSMRTVAAALSPIQRFFAAPLIQRATGLLVIAEEQPHYDNAVTLDANETDEFGVPRLVATHHYSHRDLAARRRLIHRAREIHRAAGARVQYVHHIDTFSHALGTIRMGDDPTRNPLDADCRFRGIENLYVADGSALPTAAGVNPSLTIAANALRVGDRIASRAHRVASGRRRLAVH